MFPKREDDVEQICSQSDVMFFSSAAAVIKSLYADFFHENRSKEHTGARELRSVTSLFVYKLAPPG